MSHCCSKPAIIYITSNSVTDRLDLNSFQFRIPHSGIIEPVMEFSSAEWIEINIDNEKKKFVESEKKKKKFRIPNSAFRIPELYKSVMKFNSVQMIAVKFISERNIKKKQKKTLPDSGIIQICHRVQFCRTDGCKIHQRTKYNKKKAKKKTLPDSAFRIPDFETKSLLTVAN